MFSGPTKGTSLHKTTSFDVLSANIGATALGVASRKNPPPKKKLAEWTFDWQFRMCRAKSRHLIVMKFWLSSVCWPLCAKPGNELECRIYEGCVKMTVLFLCRLWSKRHKNRTVMFTHPPWILHSASLPGFADGDQQTELNQTLPSKEKIRKKFMFLLCF